MKTIREVADLAGVSVRTLQYYDEIGLLKPTKVNDAGYRFYDDAVLEKLQQILFFKELDFQLKDIKEIMSSETYDKTEVFSKQKRLLTVKRDRLNRLLSLLERLETGETIMSFKEFDMSEYIEALEQFGMGSSESDIWKAAKGATVEEGLALKGSTVKSAKPQIKKWMKNNNLI